ncbi:MAG: hypothetical protein E7649_04760 [Ruminococcaceae bacterium]|nr:hypothetical protein [Oscillospiraceae bacterium]
MLTFLFGAPKSGKTTYIMDRIRENIKNGQKTYLLVPEQQLFISESMLRDLPPSSALYFEVIGFSRLCEIVFSKYGGVSNAKVSSGIKKLIMWQTLKELSSSLSQYKNIKVDSAFIDMMLSSLDELRANSISPDACSIAAEKCEEPILARKLSDLSAIYQLYKLKLEECVGEDALINEDKLHRLAEILSNNGFFAQTEVFIDSFTDFTGEEFDIIESILRQAKHTYISFTYRRGLSSPHTVTLSDTVKRLTAYARNHGIKTFDITLDKDRGRPQTELDVIERCIWDFGINKNNTPIVDKQHRGQVESYVCENEYEEAWLAALNIIKARKHGIKYSEIVIIARDPESRRGMLEAVLDGTSIPYFYSERTDLSATAPAKLILSALRCVTHNFQQTDVINLIKTGLCAIDMRDADLFEDYCYTWSINGSQFTADSWSMNPDGYTTEMTSRSKEILNAANNVRCELIPPLINLRTAIKAADGNVTEACRAVYCYLEAIRLEQSISRLAEHALSAGNVKEAGELLRVYDFIISTLTDICTVMNGIRMTSEDIYSAIEIMLKNTDIGSVPAINDCVTVGSAATLRTENVKVAIVLGLCDGEFPASFHDNGMLSESDKDAMSTLEIPLSSRENKIISDELFYVYRAMTKPTERLILSTCRSSVGGRACSPSTAFNRVHAILPHLTPKPFDLTGIRMLADALAHYELESTDEEQTDCGNSDIIYTEEGEIVDPKFVRMLFGDNLHLSKSKITSFVECPYKYWSDYVLGLREKKISEISYDNAGTIIHFALENLVRRLLLPDGGLTIIPEDELIQAVDEILDKYVSEISCPLSPYTLHSFSRLRDLALIMAHSVIEEFSQSSFKVVGLEKHISSRRVGALKPMIIKTGEDNDAPTVSLGGVIDRVDCFDDGARKYIRVIDYKTGSHTFDIDKVDSGEDVQLPAYLFTASLEQNKSIFGADSNTEIVPAAALFLSAEEKDGTVSPTRRGFILNEENVITASSAIKNSKMLAGISYNKDGSLSARSKAAVSQDDMAEMRKSLIDTVSTTAKDMYSGEIFRTPSDSACKFCSVKSSCPVAIKN